MPDLMQSSDQLPAGRGALPPAPALASGVAHRIGGAKAPRWSRLPTTGGTRAQAAAT